MKKIIILVIVIVVIVVGWYALSPFFIRNSANDVSPLTNQQTTQSNSISSVGATSSDEMKILAVGNFVSDAHEVRGKVLIIQTGEKKILRFEDFYTLNGPNLRVYLSKDTTNKDFIDVSPLKATDGNVNYEIPTSADISVYNNVLIWCKDFRVLFGHAELK